MPTMIGNDSTRARVHAKSFAASRDIIAASYLNRNQGREHIEHRRYGIPATRRRLPPRERKPRSAEFDGHVAPGSANTERPRFERQINSLQATPNALARLRVNSERSKPFSLDENVQGRILERQDRVSSGGADRAHALNRVW
jgi:hypothetical protein